MSVLKKGTALYAIWHQKCPRCQEGNLFETRTFSFSKPFYMPKHCGNCGQTFEPEPGFYYGAMFLSYIITSFFCLGFVGFMMLVLKQSMGTAFALLLAVIAILFVWFFRTARAVWIVMNVRYDPRRNE